MIDSNCKHSYPLFISTVTPCISQYTWATSTHCHHCRLYLSNYHYRTIQQQQTMSVRYIYIQLVVSNLTSSSVSSTFGVLTLFASPMTDGSGDRMKLESGESTDAGIDTACNKTAARLDDSELGSVANQILYQFTVYQCPHWHDTKQNREITYGYSTTVVVPAKRCYDIQSSTNQCYVTVRAYYRTTYRHTPRGSQCYQLQAITILNRMIEANRGGS